MLNWDERLNTPECSGSAIIVAAFYRHYALWASSEFDNNLTAAAARVYAGVSKKIDASGWVTQVRVPLLK
jgi:rhamnogalacturonyl hydrolase YesR